MLLTYPKILVYVISPGLIQLVRVFLVSKQKTILEGDVILGNFGGLHSSNCCKGAVACLPVYREGGIIGITFCHQTSGPAPGRAYNQDFTVGW